MFIPAQGNVYKYRPLQVTWQPIWKIIHFILNFAFWGFKKIELGINVTNLAA